MTPKKEKRINLKAHSDKLIVVEESVIELVDVNKG